MALSDIIYWRDVKVSAPVFTAILVILIWLTQHTVISVFTTLTIFILTLTIGLRSLFNVKSAVMKTELTNPFQDWLEEDLTYFKDKEGNYGHRLMEKIEKVIKEVRRLFLVEDFVDSFKLLAILYIASYIGQWFSGLTVIFIVFIATFTLPKLYETYQFEIHNLSDSARSLAADLHNTLCEKLPFMKKSKKPEKTSSKDKDGIDEIDRKDK